jgi:hypothetical protein
MLLLLLLLPLLLPLVALPLLLLLLAMLVPLLLLPLLLLLCVEDLVMLERGGLNKYAFCAGDEDMLLGMIDEGTILPPGVLGEIVREIGEEDGDRAADWNML